jgi:hypothetical protein
MKSTAWGYADCDRDGPQGERSLPWLKPVWDVDLFIGADIFTLGAIFSADIIQAALSLLAPANELHSLNWDFLIAGIVLATEKLQACSRASAPSRIPPRPPGASKPGTGMAIDGPPPGDCLALSELWYQAQP